MLVRHNNHVSRMFLPQIRCKFHEAPHLGRGKRSLPRSCQHYMVHVARDNVACSSRSDSFSTHIHLRMSMALRAMIPPAVVGASQF
jgi:hypothetical protein